MRFLPRRLEGIGTQLDTNPIPYIRGTPVAGKRVPGRKLGPWPENGTPDRKTVPLAGKRYTWPGNVTNGRKRFPEFGKRPPASENVAGFARKMVISRISTNLSFWGLARNFGALAVFPGRHYHLAGKQSTWQENVFLISENTS